MVSPASDAPIQKTPGFRHDRAGTPAAAWRAHPAWAALPPLTPYADGSVRRLVVVAAHPDDESLGAGGLVAAAHDAGNAVTLVVATLGERSHPRSPTHPPEALARRRRVESEAALREVAPYAETVVADLPDGDLAAHTTELTDLLVGLLADGRDALLVAPWRRDGHPDHEAAGRAAAAAAVRSGARLLEYPIWWWHWSQPATADLAAFRTVALTADQATRKAAAIAAHASQVAPLSDAPGDEVLLGPDLLAHFAGPVEVVVVEPAVDPALDELHARAEDPWGVDRRWYEARRRALLLGVLPRRRFRRALEVGCSTGALTAALADRCDEVVGIDDSAAALAGARRRLAERPTGAGGVRLERGRVPTDWSAGPFDLVVVSEVGYFLSPVDLDALIDHLAKVRSGEAGADAGDGTGGVVVAAHWRHPVDGWVLDGPEVHRRCSVRLGVPVATYADRDVEVLVWADEGALPDPGSD